AAARAPAHGPPAPRDPGAGLGAPGQTLGRRRPPGPAPLHGETDRPRPTAPPRAIRKAAHRQPTGGTRGSHDQQRVRHADPPAPGPRGMYPQVPPGAGGTRMSERSTDWDELFLRYLAGEGD